jgi:hypothetical protein
MFSSNNTRPPPPSGRPPPYAFVTRVYKRTLRPVVIFITLITSIWALVWAVDAFQDISYHRQFLPQLATFDIALGSLYIAVAVIEAFGIFAAVKATISLVRFYSIASIVALLCALAAESVRTALHFQFKGQLIDECTNELTGLTVRHGGYFRPGSTEILNPDRARELCSGYWNHDSFRNIAWLIVALLLGLFFVSIAFSFYRQLLDPSTVRTAPTNVYRMQAQGMYPPPQGPIPGYAPYNPYPDYVPPYDPHKPPIYSQGGWSGPTGDEKNGYEHNTGAASTTHLNAQEERDEGFDPAAVQAAIRASEQNAATNTRKDEGPGGSGAR